MADQIAAPQPVNPVISIKPLATPAPGRDTANVQTQLAALPTGTILEGFVVGRDPQSNPIMRTSVGDIQIQSDVFVKTGSELVIRVDASQESRARLVSIDGATPQDYAALNTRGVLTKDTIVPSQLLQQEAEALANASAVPAATAGSAAQPTSQLPPAVTVQALFLNPVTASKSSAALAVLPELTNPIPAALLKLQVGAALKITVLQLQLPKALTAAATPVQLPKTPPSPTAPSQDLAKPPQPPTGAGQAPVEQAETASPQAAQAAQPSPAVSPRANAAAPAPAPPPGATTTPMAAAAPSAPPTAVLQATPATNSTTHIAMIPEAKPIALPTNALPAIVIGHEAGGANILQTHFGTLKLFTPAPLPIQSQLTLQVEPEATRPAAPSIQPINIPPEQTEDAITPLSRSWPTMDEALSAPASQPRQMAELAQAIPHVAGDKFTSSVLFFISAVKGGDLRQWMGGKMVDALERSLPDIASKLKADIGQMQQLFTHSPLENWSGILLPMMHEGQMEYARLYVRDEPPETSSGDKGARGKEQRFILELDLSHLGEMQFDGFVRQSSPAKQFDLIIRTARPLDATISQEIRTRFEDAMGATGYKGYLGFQQGPQHFVRPLAATNKATSGDPHTILA